MKKGQIYEGIIERVDFPNKGIVFVPEEEQYVIVKNGIPGQKIRFMINKFKRGNAEGRLLEVLEKSPLETREPVCISSFKLVYHKTDLLSRNPIFHNNILFFLRNKYNPLVWEIYTGDKGAGLQYLSCLWWLYVSDNAIRRTGEDERRADPQDHGSGSKGRVSFRGCEAQPEGISLP